MTEKKYLDFPGLQDYDERIKQKISTEISEALTGEVGAVTDEENGLMLSEDKIKLDGISAGANAVSFTQTQSSGTKVGTITINGDNIDLYAPSPIKKIFYGTCDTAANQQIKVVTVSSDQGFILSVGTVIYVKFTNNNTYTSTTDNPVKIDVNSSGAKAIIYGNTVLNNTTNTTAFGRANYTNQYIYDGTNWVWQGSSSDNNSTGYLSTGGGTVTGTTIFSKTADASGIADNSPALIVGSKSGDHLELDNNEIMAKATATTTGPLYINNDGGKVYINSKLAGKVTETPTSGQVMIADGTDGGMKTSGYTINKSVPSNAVFTDTTYTFAEGSTNGAFSVTPSGGSAQSVLVHGLGSAAYKAESDFAVSKELTNEDLNSVTAPGFYNAGGSNTCTNKPSGVTGAFGLTVGHSAAGTYYWQEYNPNGQYKFYRRICSNGTWGSWYEMKLSDTLNTAGSTDSSSKLYLIGATTQEANSQTYSDNEVYVTSGVLTTKSVQVGGTSATIEYDSSAQCISFVFS